MARFMKGDVVTLPFPFSDATGAKRRPALVIANLPYFGGTDYLVCLITSQSVGDASSIEMVPGDLLGGTLTKKSYLCPLYLFAAEEGVIIRRIGTLAPTKLALVVRAITEMVNR